jgi:hypothetical protein
MKISDLFEQPVAGKVTRIAPNEVVVTDPESGIETKIPKKPNEPGTIMRDKEGKLVLDPETPGDVADDIEPGEDIITSIKGAKGTQGTLGTQGSM